MSEPVAPDNFPNWTSSLLERDDFSQRRAQRGMWNKNDPGRLVTEGVCHERCDPRSACERSHGSTRAVQSAKPISWVSLICELQRDWNRDLTVAGFAEILFAVEGR
jgi:hypothetical protein